MPRNRLQGNLDGNHTAIMSVWRMLFCSVADTSAQGGFVDAVISNHRGETVIVEIKTPNGKIACSQLETLGRWRGYAALVTDTTEAKAVASFPSTACLTPHEKRKLLEIATQRRATSFSKNPEILVSVVRKALGY